MKMYNVGISDKVIELFKEDKSNIQLLFNVDSFEDNINKVAPDMLDECYLLTTALKKGLFNYNIFLPYAFTNKELIEYYQTISELNKQQSLFLLGVFKRIFSKIEIKFNILNQDLDNIIETFNTGNKFEKKMLGYCYYSGKGVDQDYEKSYNLFLEVLDSGDYSVLSNIGYMLEYGLGVEANINKAIDYYKRGSLNDDNKCLYYLGMCYLLGKGVKKDEKIAINYLKQSHYDLAYLQLAKIYEEQGMSGEAFFYYLKGANACNGYCLYKAGVSYLEGKGVDRDLNKAMENLEGAAYLYESEAFYQLGLIYLKGIDGNKEIDKGLNFIKKGASLGSSEANIALAKMYEIGRFVEKDIYMSIDFYKKAIDLMSDKEDK